MSERHHYWPITVSSFWADHDGCVNRLAHDGTHLRTRPKNLALLKDGHRIKVEGPWDSSIEARFHSADNQARSLIERLMHCEARGGVEFRPFHERLLPQPLPDGLRGQFGEVLASLVVRSPGFRHSLALTTDHYRQGMPYRDEQDRKNLIVLNMNQQYNSIIQSLNTKSKIILMISDTKEFIFGDGFLSRNLEQCNLGTAKLLIPLTPTICAAYYRPTKYNAFPDLLSIRLSPDEVEICNYIAQVYTKDYLYYKSERPTITEAFSVGEFRVLSGDRQPWLDSLLNAAASTMWRQEADDRGRLTWRGRPLPAPDRRFHNEFPAT